MANPANLLDLAERLLSRNRGKVMTLHHLASPIHTDQKMWVDELGLQTRSPSFGNGDLAFP